MDKALLDISRQLKKIERDTPPFESFPPELMASSHFVAPKLIAASSRRFIPAS